MWKIDLQKIDHIQDNYKSKTENTFIYQRYSSVLENLKSLNIQDESIIKSINDTLLNLEKEWDIIKISNYINELENISFNYKTNKTTILDSSRNDRQEVSVWEWRVLPKLREESSSNNSTTLEKPFSQYISKMSQNPDLIKELEDKIKEIDFHGKYSASELKQKIINLSEAIKNREVWKTITEEERKALIESLNTIVEWASISEEISLAKIESYFDNLRNWIKEENGKFYIEYKDWEINKRHYFNSKEEALQAINNSKELAKNELESFSSMLIWTTLEWVLGWIWTFFKWAWFTLLKFYWIQFDFISSWFKSSFNNFRDFLNTWDYVDVFYSLTNLAISWASLSIIIWAHSWAFESFHRRFVLDFFRSWDKTNNPKYVYEDYIRKNIPLSGANDSQYMNDFNNVKQREEALSMLRNKLDSLAVWSNEYNRLLRTINNLEKLRLNRTSTFEILFYRYVQYDWDKLWSFANWLKNIFFRWSKTPILFLPRKWENWWSFFINYEKDDSPIIYNRWFDKLLSDNNKNFNEWLKFLYPSKSLSYSSQEGLKIEWNDEKSDIYNWIMKYIDDKYENQETRNIFKEKINRYFDWRLQSWWLKTKESIMYDLYSILEKDYIFPRDWISIVDERIIEIESNFKLFSIWRVSNLRFFNFFAWELSVLRDLKNKIQNKQWIWTEQELRKIIEDIKVRRFSWFVRSNSKEKLYSTEMQNNVNKFFSETLQDKIEAFKEAENEKLANESENKRLNEEAENKRISLENAENERLAGIENWLDKLEKNKTSLQTLLEDIEKNHKNPERIKEILWDNELLIKEFNISRILKNGNNDLSEQLKWEIRKNIKIINSKIEYIGNNKNNNKSFSELIQDFERINNTKDSSSQKPIIDRIKINEKTNQKSKTQQESRPKTSTERVVPLINTQEKINEQIRGLEKLENRALATLEASNLTTQEKSKILLDIRRTFRDFRNKIKEWRTNYKLEVIQENINQKFKENWIPNWLMTNSDIDNYISSRNSLLWNLEARWFKIDSNKRIISDIVNRTWIPKEEASFVRFLRYISKAL